MDAQPLLDMTQVLVHRPDEVGEPRVVDGLEREIARRNGVFIGGDELRVTSRRSRQAVAAVHSGLRVVRIDQAAAQ